MRLKKTQIKNDKAVFALLSAPFSMLFTILWWLSIIVFIACITFIAMSSFGWRAPLSASEIVFLLCIGILMYLIGPVFKLAGMELESMESDEKSYAIMAVLISMISLVIALVSLLR